MRFFASTVVFTLAKTGSVLSSSNPSYLRRFEENHRMLDEVEADAEIMETTMQDTQSPEDSGVMTSETVDACMEFVKRIQAPLMAVVSQLPPFDEMKDVTDSVPGVSSLSANFPMIGSIDPLSVDIGDQIQRSLDCMNTAVCSGSGALGETFDQALATLTLLTGSVSSALQKCVSEFDPSCFTAAIGGIAGQISLSALSIPNPSKAQNEVEAFISCVSSSTQL